MKITTMDIKNLPEEYRPAIEELPKDMQVMAYALEEDFPGQAVQIVLSLAQRIGGAWYYVRKFDKLSLSWRNNTIRNMYDSGEYTAKDLSRIWRLSIRQIQYILAEPSCNPKVHGTG
ncbi:MAG: Mor transcription activator family protein [Desulfobulbus sp.]